MAKLTPLPSAIEKLLIDPPMQLLQAAPKRYAPLRPSAQGSWKAVLYGGVPIAIAWTDWNKGFDIINLQTDEPTDRLGNYVITSKALDIPASWAYTTLGTVVASYGFDQDTTLSNQTNGKLGDIARSQEPSGGEVDNGAG